MATEQVVEEVAEQVAERLEDAATHLDEAAEVTRQVDARAVGLFLGGIGVGVVVGFFFGYRWNKEKIKAEAFKKSEEEVKKIRELYREATIASQTKPSLDVMVEERGYSTKVTEDERPTRPSVPVAPPPPPGRPFTPAERKIVLETGKSKDLRWDYAAELATRSKDRPYIIHQDEFNQPGDEFSQVVYTYYAGDEVLADSDESKIENPDEVVGLENLGKFGHGSDDFNVLFVRNERLGLEFEICYVPQSHEEEVLGLSDEQQD